MDPLFIDDGFTRRHTIAAVAGLHPAVEIVFRPSLSKERLAYAAKLATRDPEQIERYECDAIAKYVQEINGQVAAQWRDRVRSLVPTVRQQILDQVFGYTASQEGADVKNSASG